MRRRFGVIALLGLAGAAVLAAVAEVGEQAPADAPLVSVQPADTVMWPAGAAGPLTCAPHDRRFRTLPSLQPTAYCVGAREGVEPAGGEGILLTPRPDPRVDAGEQFGLMLFSGTG